MSEPFVAEIRIFAGNFAPRGWAFCNGQLLPIAQNTALFSLVGTIYGGDGETTLALPNLQGRAPMHAGNGPGLSARSLGEAGGSDTVGLTESQLPNHTHALRASPNPAEAAAASLPAGGGRGLARVVGGSVYADPANLIDMPAVGDAGGSQAHNNLQPFLALNFIIALVGLYPSES
ncbi:phage tail protein [Pseudomarimonas salicorniae]|uniref:Tail fiber protein n=1 Tax=Pseudomarimonas salicorniae TaxID=2933270 RepID=A0ABT0GKA2_9GAMM|nr:tail fiber protein [Lysobacter sp. CAU 1642]MCK7594969.1 tail fiber protein [Lysobacter sp. CAU 1642]